ncbi:aminoglycoside phosphotransferase family protein [Shewanella maritima]|uniref:aminoglycoside phosphotransferase family protein n=1 Tax=Shewanella maritima TaxID=2520507 RepID=UPI0037353BD2
MSVSDIRLIELEAWLASIFDNSVKVTLISGDASFRRYFRVTHQGQHYIVADSPVELVPITPFITMAKAYEQADIFAPKVLAFEADKGFVLQTDLGDRQLLDALTEENVSDYYQTGLGLLPHIAKVTCTEQGTLTAFDQSFVKRELHIFVEWLLEKHLSYQLTDAENTMLDNVFNRLTDNALFQPQVGMHRDFHSRNILLVDDQLAGKQLAVIDFQDAVIGPVTYDAVSLLRDCYVKWPTSIVTQLMKHHYQLCLQQGLIPSSTSFNDYQQWFDFMGMQRHIKAAGIFARLYHRDDKAGYLKDIPLTLSYVVDIGSQYPEFRQFSQWVNDIVIPAVNAKNHR